MEAQVALHIVLLVMFLCVVIACCNHFYFEGSAKRKNKRILPGNRMLLSIYLHYSFHSFPYDHNTYVLSFHLKAQHFHQSHINKTIHYSILIIFVDIKYLLNMSVSYWSHSWNCGKLFDSAWKSQIGLCYKLLLQSNWQQTEHSYM